MRLFGTIVQLRAICLQEPQSFAESGELWLQQRVSLTLIYPYKKQQTLSPLACMLADSCNF